jgi:hypothetical protein
MIPYLIGLVLAAMTTVGFVRSIRREVGARATPVEWFLSAEVGILVGIFGLSLFRVH